MNVAERSPSVEKRLPPGEWLDRAPPALLPLDDTEARRWFGELSANLRSEGFGAAADALESSKELAAFFAAVVDLSPFIRDTLRRRPQIIDDMSRLGANAVIEAAIASIEALPSSEDISEAALMRGLRQAKSTAQVVIALADLAGDGAERTVERLTRLAEAAVSAAIGFLLVQAHERGKIRLPDPASPGTGSGLIVLGMGKLGGRELNFSSDIDLILFFDPAAPAIIDPYEAADLFVRLARQLVRILQDRTEDGYVFRTDLRLRPDPGSTPLAIPVEAALNYYEGRGQNWERAAMIKARPVAGDIAAGDAFLRELTPYVWRKYLDYAAIADVHSIKRQIHAHKGHGEVAVAGHNVKLGRGGIREIEFFVQTQQLIAGGRFPELRGRRTVPMLASLARGGFISAEASAVLARQYWFLRDVEHAIQMVADEQTHVLPEDEAGLSRIAHMRGYRDASAFAATFRASLHAVESHYAALFETAPQLSTGVGNLVFTGDVDDPDTLVTLSTLGFERPSDICRVIRSWHFGRYRATRSAEARERLTELTPALLAAFGRTRRADEALMRFDQFLSGLPAGIQLFSLLHSNPALLELIATIMGAAPRLAEIITRRPHVFDGLLDPSLLSELPDKAYLRARLQTFLEGAQFHEETLDRLRIFAAEQKFLIGVRLLSGSIDATRAGKAFSDLADLTIASAFDAVAEEFAARHGRVKGARVAILGMGKLGSRELTAGSDVDLILLYDHDEDADESDGERPLAPSHYYGRLTQRLIAAVSAPTGEGVLYELDLRLRPSGNKGPIATYLSSFRKYQREEAWTWEHMALTRARPVAGDPDLMEATEKEIEAILALPHDAEKVLADAQEMRHLIAEEKPAKNLFDLKLAAGGLIDLEFIAQTAVLTGGKGRRSPATVDNLTLAACDAQAHEELKSALTLYQALTQVMRLCLTAPFDPKETPPGFVDLMLRVADLPDLGVLEAHLEETQRRVRSQFDALLRPGRKRR